MTRSGWLGSVAAVLGGFGATFVLSLGTDIVLHAAGVYPPWGVRMSEGLFVLAALYRAIYTVAGGWVTARLAPANPGRHAAVLAVLGLLGGFAGVAAALQGGDVLGPLWYALSIPASAVPCIALGAWLAGRSG